MSAPRRWFVVLSLCFFPALTPTRAIPQDKLWRPEIDPKILPSTFTIDWYGVYLGEKKIGYLSTRREALAGNKIRETMLMKLKIASFGGKAEVNLSQTMDYEATPPYRLTRAESRQDAGDVNIVTLLEKADKGYAGTRTLGKVETKIKLDDLDYTLADAMAAELWLRTGPKEGDRIISREFSLDDLKVESQSSKVVEHKKSLVKGVEVQFFGVETVSDRSRKTAMKTLHDEQGRLLSGKITIFDMRKETEEQAKNTEFATDLFVLGQVKVDKGLGRIENLEEVILEVHGKGGEYIPNGPWQKIEAGKDGTRVLKVGKKHGVASKPSEKEIKEALEETLALPLSDPKIKEMAARAIEDAKTDEEKVKKLVRFTHRFIRPKLSGNPPEIFHILENKAGDCKSYARLFCTLARAAGVPAREVSGFVYMGDDVKAFGGHAWNEVVLDGVWVPIDASIGRPSPTAGHIFLGTEREASGILETIGKLNFKVMESR